MKNEVLKSDIITNSLNVLKTSYGGNHKVLMTKIILIIMTIYLFLAANDAYSLFWGGNNPVFFTLSTFEKDLPII